MSSKQWVHSLFAECGGVKPLRFPYCRWCAVLLALTCAPPLARAATLDEALAAHAQSRAGVATLVGRVDIHRKQVSNPNEKGEKRKWDESRARGDFWWAGDSLRIRYDKDGATDVQETVLHDSLMTRVYHHRSADPSNKGRQGGALGPSSKVQCTDADPRCATLFTLWDPNGVELMDLATLVRGARKVKKAAERSVEGRTLFVIELDYPRNKEFTVKGNWSIEIFLDPAANYLIWKEERQVETQSAGTYRHAAEVTGFQEHQPGVFLPTGVQNKSFQGDQETLSVTTTLSAVRVNEPIPESMFRLRFPHNALVADNIRNTMYRVDAEGRRIFEEQPINRSPGTLNPITAPVTPPPAGEITKEEPKSWNRWILPGAAAVLVLAGGVAVWKRRRATVG